LAREISTIADGVEFIELFPDVGEAIPGEGIPLSPGVEDLLGVFPDASYALANKLLGALQRRGLVRYTDYDKPEAKNKIRSALTEVLRYDVGRIVTAFETKEVD